MPNKTNAPYPRRLGIAVALVLMVAVGAGAWLLLTAQTAPPGPVVSSTSLEGVDLEAVLDVGVLPADVRPKVSRQVAEQVALDNARYTSLRGAVFARVTTSIFDGPAWIVSLDPGDWAPPGPSGVVEYLIVIVDAETGDFILGQSSTAEPPGGWTDDSGGPAPPLQPMSAPAGIGQ